MTVKKAATAFSALLLSVFTVPATHLWEDSQGWWDNHFTYDSTTSKYNGQEVSLDLFGSYLHREEKFDNVLKEDLNHDGSWGGGVGLNYFFCRNFGIGGDVNMSAREGRIVDQVLGNGIIRLPLGTSGVAPYVFGGGGRGIYPSWEWLADAGFGLEFRFNPTTGIYSDVRYIWAENPNDRLVIRAGVRLTF